MTDFKTLHGKTILVTGHTGFKGSWLASWLVQLGAKVVGYSLPSQTEPSHIEHLNLDMVSIHGDIRDGDSLKKVFLNHKPEIVFHMAAQSLVRASYEDPIETYSTNVMGTLQVFEAARACERVRALINVTSDKCYENKEWPWGYRENDPMGGYDPYSSSKGCAELLTSSYRNSFFPTESYGQKHETLLASVRAGNVIGGGDWAQNRLIPDAIRAIKEKQTLKIRSPQAIRPWQHVLEPLRGYLTLALQLLAGNKEAATGWNFGPRDENCITVEQVLNKLKLSLPDLHFEVEANPYHEAHFLKLDSSKAQNLLNFCPLLGIDETLEWTAQWYQTFAETRELMTEEQVSQYQQRRPKSFNV
jgi:CDP-glucose 4,6-dehydratase